MKRLIMAALLVLCMDKTQAQAFQTVKSWTFVLEHGSLRVDLKSSSDGKSSLGLSPNGQKPEAPISEQIGPLKQVLDEMPSLGIDPHKIVYIGTRIYTQDVLEKIAYMCADSQAWRLSIRNKGKGKEQVLISLLNQSTAYEPYDRVFRQYGIQARVSEVENLGLMRFSSVAERDARDHADAKLLVPADAIIGMRLLPVDSSAVKRGHNTPDREL